MTAHKCQQFELYAAEDQVLRGQQFTEVTEIQDFVTGLRDTWWWGMWYPQVRHIEVYPRPTKMHESVGWYEPDKNAGAIEMLPCHWDELTVLHELSHVLASARHGSRAHDPAFARVYLELVALVMGPEVYHSLYESFTAHGIQFDYDDIHERLGGARRMPPADLGGDYCECCDPDTKFCKRR